MSTICNSVHQEPAGVEHRCELPSGHVGDHQDAFVRWPARKFAVLTPSGPRVVPEDQPLPGPTAQGRERATVVQIIPGKPGHSVLIVGGEAPLDGTAYYVDVETQDRTEIGKVSALVGAAFAPSITSGRADPAIERAAVTELTRQDSESSVGEGLLSIIGSAEPLRMLRPGEFGDIAKLRAMLTRAGVKFQEHKTSEWLAPKVAAVRKPAVSQVLILVGASDVSAFFDEDGRLVDFEATVPKDPEPSDRDRLREMLTKAKIQFEERPFWPVGDDEDRIRWVTSFEGATWFFDREDGLVSVRMW